MKLQRVAHLVAKELAYSSKSFVFVFVVVVPLVLSLAISLLVGTLFAGKPRLGVADLGDSQLTEGLARHEYLMVREYESAGLLERDVLRGALDMGLVLPAGFDRQLQGESTASVDVYVWGESLLRDRATLGVALSRQIIALAGREIPVEAVVSLLGEGASVPWDVRLFPMVVAMTIILGGTMVPATSLVDEKQKRTLTALTITPTSLGEVLTAKAIAGGVVSLAMGMAILVINRAFGAQPGLVILLVALGATLSATLGVIVGSLVNDISTLFTVMKSLGIVLYAPALLYLFPEVPSWVARIFPTYYMIGPIVETSLHGAGWREIALDVYVLIGLIALTIVLAGLVARRRPLARLA